MNTQLTINDYYPAENASLEDIYEKYRNPLAHYAAKIMGEGFYADDIVQDVFVNLLQQTNYFVSEAAALKYIFKAVYNRCIDFTRHRQIEQRYEEIYSNRISKSLLKDEANELVTKEFVMLVNKQINSLPPKCRQIFEMKYTYECSNQKICKKLGLSIRTVENQVYIARNVLRRQVESYLCS